MYVCYCAVPYVSGVCMCITVLCHMCVSYVCVSLCCAICEWCMNVHDCVVSYAYVGVNILIFISRYKSIIH